jgi:hypothetical protein
MSLVLVIGMLNPIVFFPTLPLTLLFLAARQFYLRTSRDVKRLEATSELRPSTGRRQWSCSAQHDAHARQRHTRRSYGYPCVWRTGARNARVSCTRQRAHGSVRDDTIDGALVCRLHRLHSRRVYSVCDVHLCAHGIR